MPPATTPVVCFVGSPEFGDFSDDDRHLVDPLAAAGLGHDYRSWDDSGADWPSYDAVVVRTPWDYYLRIREFLAWVRARGADGTNLWNPADVVEWNADKRYLEELRSADVPVVPTAFLEGGGAANLSALLAERGWGRAVVKPAVSAGAHRTWTVRRGEPVPRECAELLAEPGTAIMVQPFVNEVTAEGEWSLLFFGGQYSHAVLKRPASGDFRVQEKHGGTLAPVEPGPDLVASAQRVLTHSPGDLLYARVDGVRRGGELVLMELEVLEPVLFFAQDPASPGRFVAALVERLRPRGDARPSSSRGPR